MKISNNKVHSEGKGGEKSCLRKVWTVVFSSTIKETVDEVYDKIATNNARREEEIRQIVVEGVCTVSLWNLLWQSAGICLGMLAVMAGFVFWPTDNVFLEPHRWYQCVLQCGVVWIGQCFQ